jgi:1L-myo-inositol 1-phosphate cytidylyltransferase / CDP-L-myo-inositol myo-inositolphosphotransferase
MGVPAETSDGPEASKELGNVISAAAVPVRRALVLAAGNGDRFKSTSGTSKLLQSVLGQTLIIRTLETARLAGITSFDVVVGYRAPDLQAAIELQRPAGVAIRFTHNPDWHLENGLSALAAREHLARERFALLMGDHLFEPGVLARALKAPVGRGESLLAVDSRRVASEIAAEATKVSMSGGYIDAIGKDLQAYNALDTGLFVCDPNLFDALEDSRSAGDTTLSGGIRRLAARGLMRALDVGDAQWCDIDTAADLETAEALLANEPEPA